MDPVNINNPGLWDVLFKIFGAGGIPLLLGCGGLAWLVKQQNQRIKEKDEECRAEMDKAEARWDVRFQQMRTDIKEAFGHVGELTDQVTRLAERSTLTRTRSDL